MARLDKQTVISMIQSGETDTAIAKRFGTTRQAVNLLRRSLVKARDAGTTRNGSHDTLQAQNQRETVMTRLSAPLSTPEQTANPVSPPTHPTFDQLTDWIIHIIGEAGEARRLRHDYQMATAEIRRLQDQVASLTHDLAQTAAQLAAYTAKAQAFDRQIKQAELPPLTGQHMDVSFNRANLTDQSHK